MSSRRRAPVSTDLRTASSASHFKDFRSGARLPFLLPFGCALWGILCSGRVEMEKQRRSCAVFTMRAALVLEVKNANQVMWFMVHSLPSWNGQQPKRDKNLALRGPRSTIFSAHLTISGNYL